MPTTNTTPVLVGDNKVAFSNGATIESIAGGHLTLNPGSGGTLGTEGLVAYTGTITVGSVHIMVKNGLVVGVS